MKWTQVPAGDINAANQRLWVALGYNADTVARYINSEPDYLKRITGLMITGGFNPTTSQQRAREIMGQNFFGIEEAIKHFGVNPSRTQTTTLSEIPFTEKMLESCKNTHILVAVFPMSILDIRGKVERKLLYSHEDSWYNNQKFGKNKGEVGWHLVRKTPVPNSTSKNWNEQQALLNESEETPSAQVMVYTIIGNFLATGERLFENTYVRTSSIDSDGRRVFVGNFDFVGLGINRYWDDRRHPPLGLSASRKS